MAMTNYRDLSTLTSDASAGFQFEFFCEVTGETWRSPFRPYRRGQLHGVIQKATYWFNGLHSFGRAAEFAANSGFAKAKAGALDDAQEMAAQRFRHCESCGKWVAHAAWDDRQGHCIECTKKAQGRYSSVGGYSESSDDGGGSSAAICPNCQTPSEGGRFCHECGFDMASAFKSCPSCGSTLPRQARFCTDCGHGF